VIHTRCPGCGTVLQVDYDQRGRRVRCPVCQEKFTVESRALRAATTEEKRTRRGKKRERQRELKVTRPLALYERLDESVLEQVPVRHRLRNTCLVAGGIALAAGLAFAVWALGRQGDSARAGSAVVMEASLPEYARVLRERIMKAGYAAERGDIEEGTRRYCCRVLRQASVRFFAYPGDADVICQGFFKCGRIRLQRSLEQEDVGRILRTVLLEFVAPVQRSSFSKWMGEKYEECWRALENSKPFSEERRFGDIVARLEHGRFDEVGRGIAVELARAAKE